MSPAASTRWCPTPEQLMILEEMYRGGVKTPNASQIQQITAHLSFYGKIEGKNVFYWFQNHKARDRQKLRRKLLQQQQQQLLHFQPIYHHYEPSSTSLGLQPFHHYPWFPQELVEEASSSQVMLNNTRKMDNCCDMEEMEKWMDISAPAPVPLCSSHTRRPLKTLELFPIKSSTSLKED
ncbi:hypothetical protein ACHQM5_017111 [Ranunculus cassubicifolius]